MLSKFEGSGTHCYKIFKKGFHSSPGTLLGGRINEAGVRVKVGGLGNLEQSFWRDFISQWSTFWSTHCSGIAGRRKLDTDGSLSSLAHSFLWAVFSVT